MPFCAVTSKLNLKKATRVATFKPKAPLPHGTVPVEAVTLVQRVLSTPKPLFIRFIELENPG